MNVGTSSLERVSELRRFLPLVLLPGMVPQAGADCRLPGLATGAVPYRSRTAWPMPSRFPSLSRNQAARSPTPADG